MLSSSTVQLVRCGAITPVLFFLRSVRSDHQDCFSRGATSKARIVRRSRGSLLVPMPRLGSSKGVSSSSGVFHPDRFVKRLFFICGKPPAEKAVFARSMIAASRECLTIPSPHPPSLRHPSRVHQWQFVCPCAGSARMFPFAAVWSILQGLVQGLPHRRSGIWSRLGADSTQSVWGQVRL